MTILSTLNTLTRPKIRPMAILTVLAYSLPVSASDDTANVKSLDDRHAQELLSVAQITPLPTIVATSSTPTDADSDTGIITLSQDELLAQPQLLAHAFGSALAYGQVSAVQYLLPLYQAHDQPDDALIWWAQALLAQHQGKFGTAIEHYRHLIAKHPEHNTIRLQLAIALFYDRQYDAAKGQLQKLESQSNLSPIISPHITHYLTLIDKIDDWQLTGGINYIQDQNINNAPTNPNLSEHWTAQEAQSAHGIGAHVGIAKKHTLAHGYQLDGDLHLGAKYYHDAKSYNEATGKLSIGITHHDAHHAVRLAPYLEHTYYAGGHSQNNPSAKLEHFSQTKGLSLSWQYTPHPQWQSTVLLDYARPRYQTRTHLDGETYFTQASLAHAPSAMQQWQLGINYTHADTQDKDDSYHRYGVRASWQQEWAHGISTQLDLGYAHRRYHAPMPIFNQTQSNHEYHIQGSIWHRNIHFMGITPRLTWQYQHQNSNIALYEYRKNHAFVELSKRF
ncbi:surface lipoprotein assembly modifier [Moraxella pluranimalium]|nr:surface lipoprotein assembly modifier [Moraxella pluranimalium]